MARGRRSRSLRSAPTSGFALNQRENHWVALRGLLPFIWPADRPDLRRRVVAAFCVLVAAKLVTVAIPVAFKEATDALTALSASQDAATNTANGLAIGITMLILAYGAGRIFMMVLNQIRDVFFSVVGQHAVRQLNNRTFEHLHKLSLRFHLERQTGGLSRVIERASRAIELIIRMGILQIVPTLFELLLVCAVLTYFFSPIYAVIVAVTVFVFMYFTFIASEWRMVIRREMNDSDTEANTKAIDSLLNFETVKYFGNERMEAQRFDKSMARYEQAAIRTNSSLGYLNSGQAAIFSIGMTLCLWLSASGIAQGTHTIGDFVMINVMMLQLYVPLNFMGWVYREIKQGLVDIETMFAVLAQKPEIEDASGAPALQVERGHLRFEAVDFAYDADRPILRNLSFDVPAGQMVAVVGSTGAGKSTLARLLFRFYDIQGGRITIDGQDIRDVSQESLRQAIGVVPQDTVLFNDTIAYNIRYGRFDASDADVREAARLAQIDAFIESLPDGYQTMVGERGLKLSGGEKQRVAIARTILKAPPILILDEATSALDSQTEEQIQAALNRVAENRTSLVIAHRLSTIVHADIILVMEKGRLIEQGTHQQLLARDGRYAALWRRQLQDQAAAKAAAEREHASVH